jgi:DNA-binding NarL/FixJ family response regulator
VSVTGAARLASRGVGYTLCMPTAGKPVTVALVNDYEMVLAMIAFGMSNVEIGKELFLSVDTVKTYVRRLYSRLGVKNRVQAAQCAAGHNVMPPESRNARRLN